MFTKRQITIINEALNLMSDHLEEDYELYEEAESDGTFREMDRISEILDDLESL